MNAGTMVALGIMLVVALSATADAGAKPPQPPDGAPEYQAPPRPTDGAQMALTIEKLEKGFDPPRPFLIWAIGSSFTNSIRGHTLLLEPLRQRFPNGPKLAYKKMAECYFDCGKAHKALEHLETALRLVPNLKGIKKITRKLAAAEVNLSS